MAPLKILNHKKLMLAKYMNTVDLVKIKTLALYLLKIDTFKINYY